MAVQRHTTMYIDANLQYNVDELVGGSHDAQLKVEEVDDGDTFIFEIPYYGTIEVKRTDLIDLLGLKPTPVPPSGAGSGTIPTITPNTYPTQPFQPRGNPTHPGRLRAKRT